MISVAVTTYNGEKYIEKQLQSILQQSLPVDEIIISDDGSTDQTVSVIRRVIAQNKTKTSIRLRQNASNVGYTENYYLTIRETAGEYIFLADQDDIWHTDKVKKTIQIMNQNKCVAICTNFSLIDQNDAPISDETQFQTSPFLQKISCKELTPISFDQLVYGNVAQGCTYCFTRQVCDAYLKIHSPYLIHDHQILFIATLVGSVYFYNEKLIKYRIHAGNAIGFHKKGEHAVFVPRKPAKKPTMVCFMEDVDRVIPIPNKWKYTLLYYLRIPYIASIVRNLKRGS